MLWIQFTQFELRMLLIHTQMLAKFLLNLLRDLDIGSAIIHGVLGKEFRVVFVNQILLHRVSRLLEFKAKDTTWFLP